MITYREIFQAQIISFFQDFDRFAETLRCFVGEMTVHAVDVLKIHMAQQRSVVRQYSDGLGVRFSDSLFKYTVRLEAAFFAFS